ncbi:PE-PGRS family protein [Streptomyces kaniharaensis]|uniref:PE-PGRS family protein n=1 Tax=Streptomyces kaniharaensis TaxID=212423 RepID=A0A6N7KZC5_9ACTN|nr:PE-PGRS family protein [Streptomyces kaniharaensis]MQS16175.1 PE-PGRS family protein [Streptomyces kaniharaensis]
MTGGRDKLAELLQRAGLEIAGEGRIEDVLPPRAAWRPIISGGAKPTVAVRGDRPDLVAEFNAQWHRLAVDGGIIREDGVFLIDVAGNWTGRAARSWTRVRLTAQWDLAGVLGERPGQPEFVALSTNGDSLLGATTEEDEVWLVSVDRPGERQEAAAQETSQERAAAWASLLRGPGPSERLREMWANGLALNPAVPEDMHASLLDLSPFLLWRPMPASVVDAAIAHPDWKTRGRVAESQPNITAEQWARLILGEQDARHRWILTMLAADRRAELTDTAYQQLAADPSARVREETARLPGLPVRILTALAADPDPAVRALACRGAWPHLDGPARHVLIDDPDGKVRTAALLCHHQDHPMPRSVFNSEGLEDRAVETSRLERDLAEHLARHGDPAQRRSLARNPRLDPDLVTLLAQDPDEDVRFEVSKRPDLTEEQRAHVRIDFDPRAHYYPLDWVMALHDDPDAMRRLAASSHPLVRRSVARAKRLPSDVVKVLARDEDRVVRLFLAESCDDAPADMLLEVWQWWTGSLSTPDRPHGHPNFPRTNLLRYADDPNPRMRQLALDDAESTAELVERFSRDGNEEVRYRAASDPRLTSASAVRLLDDPHEHVRQAAARHPQLPARVLVGLLRDADTAEAAARCPALPAHVIRQMIQRLQFSATAPEGTLPS